MNLRAITKNHPLSIALLLLAVTALSWGRYRQWQQQHGTEVEKARLQAQITEFQQRNRELQASISYLSSPGFRDKFARTQQDLRRPGETVYAFPNQTVQPVQHQTIAPESNASQWLRYFTNRL